MISDPVLAYRTRISTRTRRQCVHNWLGNVHISQHAAHVRSASLLLLDTQCVKARVGFCIEKKITGAVGRALANIHPGMRTHTVLSGSLSLRHGASSGCGWWNGLQLWRVAANTLNKQSRTANKGWSSSLGVGRGANNSSP
jgi:hypothetical protein